MLGGGGGGAIGQFPLEQWFYEMPICTRWWTVATVATSILVQCHIITPFQLFYSFRAVFVKSQVSSTGHLEYSFGAPRDSQSRQRLTVFRSIVLAPPNHLPLLRPPLPRPPLPRFLPPALLPPPRRILRPFPRALLLASPLRH